MKSITYLCALWFALTGYTASAQNDTAFLTKTTNALNRQPAAERVYLHLDKPNYGFGDTIWYKAYTVIGQHHQLSALSGVLYVELISPKDSLVTRQTLRLLSGVAWGDIPLPKALKQGSYRIRAYTNWMRNSPDCFYDQRIRIGGVAPSVQLEASNPDVQFFPEAGQLVDGVRSRVAVKAIGVNGLGEDIKGTVQDNDGNVVAEFTTQHLGMGIFAMVPQSGKTYKAVIRIPGEASFAVDLPGAQQEGYVLTLNNSQKGSVFIKVAVNDKTFSNQKDSTFYIIAQNSGKIYYTSQAKLENLVYTAKVEKGRFPTGITQFTLFSESSGPLAERIAFIQSADTLNLNLASANQNYTSRQKVEITLNAKDNNNKPTTGSFSVAVINEGHTGGDENDENTVINNLLLTSELKGHIEQPNYYFINSNEQKQADLDVLMLTQGYRRFDWKQVLSNTSPAITYQPESSLELAGMLKTPGGKPIPNGKVTLVATKENLLRDTTTDQAGNFKFVNLYIADTATVVLRARKENKGSNVLIAVQHPTYPVLTKTSVADTALGQLPAPAVLQQYKDYKDQQKKDFLKNGIQLKQVSIQGYKHKEPDLSRSASLHPGGADQVIMGDQLGPCINLADCLPGRVHFADPEKLSVIIDGNILGTGKDYLNMVNPSDIYSIEVLHSINAKSIYGSSIAKAGALVITMKNGDEAKSDLTALPPAGLSILPFVGYAKAKVFYSPKYDVSKTNAQQTDERSTIYWAPNIITDKDGKASIEYFNNDTKGTYRVVIEGIDDEGYLGRAEYRYSVQ